MKKLNDYFFGGQPSMSDSIWFYGYITGGLLLTLFMLGVKIFA